MRVGGKGLRGKGHTEATGRGIRETIPEAVEPATRSRSAGFAHLLLIRSRSIPMHWGDVHLSRHQQIFHNIEGSHTCAEVGSVAIWECKGILDRVRIASLRGQVRLRKKSSEAAKVVNERR